MTDHSRADLLRFKKAGINPDQLATSVWFEKLFVYQVTQDISVSWDVLPGPTSVKEEEITLDDLPRSPEYFWAVTEHSSKEIPELSGPEVPEDLADLINAPPLSEDEGIYAATIRPDKKPLLAWQRLWPVLQAALSKSINNQKTDTDKLVRQVSEGQWPNKIPVKTKQHLAAQSLVLVHIPDYLHPLRQDIHNLLDKLEKQIGGQGLTLQYIQDYPGGWVNESQSQKKQKGLIDNNWRPKKWRLPEQGTPILIISDLGLYSRTPSLVNDWLKLGRQLKTAGFSPTILVPLPEILIPKEFTALYQCLGWDQGSTLNPAKGRFNLDQIQAKLTSLRQSLGCNFTVNESQDKADKVGQPVKSFLSCDGICLEDKVRKEYLVWLSAAVEVDENDLRAVRLGLGKPLSIADEVLIWQSNLIEKSSNLFAFPPKIHEQLRDQLLHQVTQQPKQAVKVFMALKATLKTQLATDYYEAILFFKDLPHLTPDDQQLLGQAEKYINSFIRALAVPETGRRHSEYSGIHDYSEQILSRLGKGTKKDRRYSYWWSQWHKSLSNNEDTLIPHWVDKGVLLAVNNNGSELFDIEIAIQGSNLILSVDDAYSFSSTYDLDKNWQPIFKVSTSYNHIFCTRTDKPFSNVREDIEISWNNYISFPLERTSEQSLTIEVGNHCLSLSSFKRPSWAASVQNKENQVSADLILNGIRMGFPLIGAHTVKGVRKAKWEFSSSESVGLIRKVSEDQYGIYADLNLFGITQRFRWVESGSFLMGSPEDEPEREYDEAQHTVTLTQGYWMADTCVTQELWVTVMRMNPSKFQGEQNPVDGVSWQDCWQFILKLKEQYPALRLTLPSEAQWEHACRASTTTPFSFGDQINSNQVNFNGNSPYNDGPESKYREQTVPVKSLPANPWGLYEMHGNLWEWCQDNDLREYQQGESIADPGQKWLESSESEENAIRLLRGSSWHGIGKRCRSAYRLEARAGGRLNRFGFRLSLSPELL